MSQKTKLITEANGPLICFEYLWLGWLFVYFFVHICPHCRIGKYCAIFTNQLLLLYNVTVLTLTLLDIHCIDHEAGITQAQFEEMRPTLFGLNCTGLSAVNKLCSLYFTVLWCWVSTGHPWHWPRGRHHTSPVWGDGTHFVTADCTGLSGDGGWTWGGWRPKQCSESVIIFVKYQ